MNEGDGRQQNNISGLGTKPMLMSEKVYIDIAALRNYATGMPS